MSRMSVMRFLTVMTVLTLALLFSSPAVAYTFWKGSHEDHQTELWINPNCDDISSGSPADQIRSIFGGTEAGGADAWAEQVASGCIHGDNVAPCLLGGIVFIPPAHPERCVEVPVPEGLHCVLIRPELRLDTSAGRSILGKQVNLSDAVTQMSHFGLLLCACYSNDIDALACQSRRGRSGRARAFLRRHP